MTTTALSAPQLLVLWSLVCDHSPNPALIAAVHAAWQEAKANQPTESESTS